MPTIGLSVVIGTDVPLLSFPRFHGFGQTNRSHPFNLSISSYRTEDGFSGFRVRAKYLPGDSEPVEVGRTGRLDVRELQPIVRGQIPHIKQAAQT